MYPKNPNPFDPALVVSHMLNDLPQDSGPYICALSGGADSVCLLHGLVSFRQQSGKEIGAVHIHHGIRGDAAAEDERFVRSLCKEHGVDLRVYRVDVPAYAKEKGIGTEQAARILRYEKFDELLKQQPHAYILTAHNATDQAETVLFRMARGTGLKGLGGIPQTRGRYIRPFLGVNSQTIRDYVGKNGIPFCQDESNFDPSYTRNRIRERGIPFLESVHEGAVSHIAKMAAVLREDEDFIWQTAKTLLSQTPEECLRPIVKNAHPAVAKRIIMALCNKMLPIDDGVSQARIDEIYASIQSDCRYRAFALTGNRVFYIDGDTLWCDKRETAIPPRQEVSFGVNDLIGRDAILILSREPLSLEDLSPNIYKLVIQKTFASAKMDDSYYIRSKLDGDAYSYGGMTHKVKKLFVDAKLTRKERLMRPVLCDGKGILWIPGFQAREEIKTDSTVQIYAYYMQKRRNTNEE